MARFNRPRNDYRGPEFDGEYGRFEQAYARRFARERYRMENRHARGRSPRRGPPPERAYTRFDEAYSRRYWPPAMRGRRCDY